MFDPPAEFQHEARWDDAVENADVIGREPDGLWCALFSIGPWGAAKKLMERDDGDTARVRELSLRTCVAYRGCTYLWSIGDGGCTVWQTTWTPALVTDGLVVKIVGKPHARADLLEVRSFDDDVERDTHGVEVVLRDGSFHALATMTTLASSAWAIDLARTLAAHWSVPYRHVVPAGSKPAVEAAKRASAEQATQLANGLVDAYHRWDDPDRVAAREEREARTARRDVEILSRSYIESGQCRIAAWDRDDPSRLTMVVADRTTDELLLRVVERRQVTSERDALNATLRERGDFVGATYRRSLVYWVIDGTVCMVWRGRGDICALCRVADQIEVGGRSIPLGELRAVTSFRVPERTGHRGLALELASGEQVLVGEDEDSRHDDKDRLGEGWNGALARELAGALGITVRERSEDVIARPPPPRNPALEVIEACGRPVLASSLTLEERERAAREGRVLYVYAHAWSSMGDAESDAAFTRRVGAVEDADLVFERAIPPEITGSWDAWETEADVYADFGVATV